MSQKTALWLIPLAFLVHNAEEALLMRKFLPVDPALLPEGLRSLAPSVTYPQFLLVLAFVTVLPLPFVVFGDLERNRSFSVYALLAVAAVLLFNVLSHVGSALVLGIYVPGLGTALALNLPVACYALRRAAREGWVGRRALVALPLVALLLHGPLLLGLMAAARWITDVS